MTGTGSTLTSPGLGDLPPGAAGGIGHSTGRPDARQEVTGEFAYSSDLWLDGIVWGATGTA